MYVCNLACVKLGMIFSGLLNENSFCEVFSGRKLKKVNKIESSVDLQSTRIHMNADDKAIIRKIHSLTYLSS